MRALSRAELTSLLVWAFQDQAVETASNPDADAWTLYCNVMALPVAEAATIVRCARKGEVPSTEPIELARWTRGLSFLGDMLQQPMCHLRIMQPDNGGGADQAAA